VKLAIRDREATSWMWIAYNYYLLGIRPEFEGLVIDPGIPKDWKKHAVAVESGPSV